MTIPVQIQSLIDQEMALGRYASPEDVLLRAMQALKVERELLGEGDEDPDLIASVRRGLADVAAGRVQSLADFERDFRSEHHIAPQASE